MSVIAEDGLPPLPESRLVDVVVGPVVTSAGEAFLTELDGVTVDELCRRSEESALAEGGGVGALDFAI